MDEYRIFITEEFERDFKKLDYSIKKQIQREINQLKINPFVGKPLGYRFFREKKIQNYRFYYQIYEEKIIVLIISLSGKKNQQRTIDKIKKNFEVYENELDKQLEF